jgi:ArsR family transcriptional regulator
MSCAQIMKLLADETRLAVVERLLERPRHVHELNAELRIDPTLLSHHLRVLREGGLVIAARDGKALLYRIAPNVRHASRSRALDFGCCMLCFSQPNSRTRGESS